tara:strand:- start:274 stop:486 length:213 start_codon:yes stop_codon:yes gene_type:complete
MKVITEEGMLYEYIIENKNRLPEEARDDEESFLEIIDYLLYYYEKREDYEKCSVLSNIIDNWDKLKMKKK